MSPGERGDSKLKTTNNKQQIPPLLSLRQGYGGGKKIIYERKIHHYGYQAGLFIEAIKPKTRHSSTNTRHDCRTKENNTTARNVCPNCESGGDGPGWTEGCMRKVWRWSTWLRMCN
jgi:hypothetical protein